MAQGSRIIAEANPRGKFEECIVYGTPKPGTVMQLRATAKVGGRFTYEVYAPGTNGEQRGVAVLLEDDLQGKLATDAYVSGTRGQVYWPVPGEELNMLMKDVAGTADDHAVGDVLMVESGTGKLIVTTGSPESEPFVCLEAATDPAADALLLCKYTGA